MSGGAGAEKERKSPAAIFWAFVMGFLGFLAALAKAVESLPKIFLSEHNLWITEFLPDAAVGLFAAGLLILLFGRIDWSESLRRVRLQSRRQFAALCGLAATAVVLVAFLWSPAGEVYKVRYQRSRVDWAAIRAFDHFRLRDYEAAQKELKEASRKGKSEKFSIVEKDVEGRLRDAEIMVERFRQYRKQQRPPTFNELLIASRAARLAPHIVSVKAAMADARKIVDEALAHYVKGVERIREGDTAGAVEALTRNSATCRLFLHQDLLLRHVQKREVNEQERGLIDYYTETPIEQVKRDLMEYPPIRLFRAS